MKRLIVLLLLAVFISPVSAQRLLEKTLSGYTNPEEIVSLSQNLPFDNAIEVLSQISEKLKGKKIVSTANFTSPIGIEITKMPYEKALLLIVQYNNLEYEETPNVIVVRSKNDPTKGLEDDVYADINTKEVKISALFFEANITDMQERGINWKFLLQGEGFSVGNELKTFLTGQVEGGTKTQSETPPDNQTSGNSDFEMGDYDGTLSGAFKFFETNNLGEVVARPNISVRDKQKGRIQIGSDWSIKQRDFSGNVTDVFISTGTIIEVVPYIYNEDGTDYVLLKLMVERSSGLPDAISTEIKKTTATTDVLMLNGEEIVIGGLFVNETATSRRGIPILKDLPWWVFGIKYLTGYNSETVIKKEVIILVKTEIVPSLKERVNQKQEDLINKEILENRQYLREHGSKKTNE
ncbi:MAG: type II and III secretion system protein [Ignavibacteria bacterium]|nr:type II and III secretion system protein [Ignavibacteria bacterium]